MTSVMFCVGGDGSGMGVSASNGTIFDGVGDTFLAQVVGPTDESGGVWALASVVNLLVALLSD